MRWILALTFLFTIACGKSKTTSPQINQSLGDDVPAPQRLEARPATPTECPSGGTVYSIINGQDLTSEQIVCNGANGFDTLFALTKVATPTCDSGTGLQIYFGLDTDRSHILEPSEYGAPELICDGRQGSSVAFEVLPAPATDCPAGGSTILMASSEKAGDPYSPLLPNQQSLTTCNGAQALVSPYSTSDAIHLCGTTGPYDEILLRLGNGQVLATLSDKANGQNTRLAFLPDGQFQTTDGRNCNFTLSTQAKVRSISWANKIQYSWVIN